MANKLGVEVIACCCCADGVDKVIVQSTSVAFAQGMTTTCHALVTFADGNDNGLNDIALVGYINACTMLASMILPDHLLHGNVEQAVRC